MNPRVRPVGLLVLTVGAAVIGCAELGGGPSTPAALEFEGIPFPAVITGDSLRDETGLVAPLTATAYNGSGDEIVGAPIEYIARDTGVTISPDGLLHATRESGFVRVIASINGLQSTTRRIEVTSRPDSLGAPETREHLVEYAIPDVAANASPDLRVNVRSNSGIGSANVIGWPVRWRVLHNGDTLEFGDTTFVSLRKGQTHSLLDTTSTDGSSTRRLRIHAAQLLQLVDSFIVIAEVKRHGTQLTGSPVRFVIRIEPEQP